MGYTSRDFRRITHRNAAQPFDTCSQSMNLSIASATPSSLLSATTTSAASKTCRHATILNIVWHCRSVRRTGFMANVCVMLRLHSCCHADALLPQSSSSCHSKVNVLQLGHCMLTVHSPLVLHYPLPRLSLRFVEAADHCRHHQSPSLPMHSKQATSHHACALGQVSGANHSGLSCICWLVIPYQKALDLMQLLPLMLPT